MGNHVRGQNLLVTCEDLAAARESAQCSRQRIATWYEARLKHVKQCMQHRLLAIQHTGTSDKISRSECSGRGGEALYRQRYPGFPWPVYKT
jgi:hypothetical protein